MFAVPEATVTSSALSDYLFSPAEADRLAVLLLLGSSDGNPPLSDAGTSPADLFSASLLLHSSSAGEDSVPLPLAAPFLPAISFVTSKLLNSGAENGEIEWVGKLGERDLEMTAL